MFNGWNQFGSLSCHVFIYCSTNPSINLVKPYANKWQSFEPRSEALNPWLQRDLSIFRQGFVREQATKVGLDGRGIRRQVDELTQGRVGEGELQVIRIDGRPGSVGGALPLFQWKSWKILAKKYGFSFERWRGSVKHD